MDTLTLSSSTLLFPYHSHFNSYPKLKSSSPSLSLSNLFLFQSSLFSFPRPHSGYAVSQAIRTPKFDFNLRSFEDDDYGDGNSQRKRRTRRRKSNSRSKQRRWWSDDLEEDTDVEAGILEQAVDSLLILQVFRSYGWFLPIILLSFLVATGPKAFLMASSIPFGLSVTIFAFQKLSEWLEGSPAKPHYRRKTRSKFGRRKKVFMEEEDELEEERRQGKRNKRRVYQSWVANAQNNNNNNDSGSSRVSKTSFGGWDELVLEDETHAPQRPPRDIERLQRLMEENKLSKSMDD